MRTIAIFSLIAGLLLGTALVAYFGFSQVLHALLSVGWTGFLAIIAYQLGVIALLGVCWYVLTPRSASLLAFVWGRLIRDSASEVLPLAQLGGFVMGARAAKLLGVPGSVAVASTIVDVTMELFGQLGYTALGLGILAWHRPSDPLIGWTALGLVVAFLAGMGFVTVQRRGLGIAQGALWRIAEPWVKQAAVLPRGVHDEIRHIYQRARALWLGTGLHLAVWIASSVQAWIALRFMGVDLGLGSVLAIESLLYAIRSIAFAVPNAVGVQEGAYIVLGAAFGLTPETALALSLLKRARDLVIGVPALLVWQMQESGRLVGRRLGVPSGSSDFPQRR
ncbi:MAG TPA: lysylphosphatidylglycerol synthase domain-containing protein [Burkholderiales bacterium]|nr:lysylphosphatidylglycerol synthase domain-containing protein [Burkholderiales bacterium]